MSAPKTDNCPFCGGDKHMVLPPNCTKTGDYNPGDNAQPIVRCMTCYAEAMGSPWDYTKESAVAAWNRRTDLSQASVAAALEAAAKEHDAEIVRLEAQIIENKNYLRLVGKSERSSANDFCNTAIGHHRGSAVRLRDLITPSQHDALAAHVAAARSEDDWQPISTVPRDGTKVDLWCLTYGNGIRIIDMWWTDRGGWRDGKNDFFNADAAKSATHWRKPAKSPSQIGAKP